MTGAELIIALLERQGITTIAGIPGGANLPMYDALGKSTRIRHILARHEQGAGFMAQGMARVSGRPEVCFATSGPGATNILTAIADAKLDSIPVVCITGQVATSLLGTDAFQEVDVFGMSLPCTKHNWLVRTAEELLDVVPEAFRIAASGRPGPVLIDVPKDVQNQVIEFDEWPEPAKAATPRPFPMQAIERAAKMINGARRPILYVGGGIIASGADELVREMAERANLPTTMTLMGLGTMPHDHALSLGMLGMHGARCTNYALEECDLLIAVGCRFDDRATGKAAEFCPKASIIHIDIDASELSKIKAAHIGIAADARAALEALLPMIEDNRREEWTARITELKREFPLDMPGADDARTPYGLILAAAAAAGPDAVVTTDVGQHQMWTAQAYPFTRPRQWLTSGGLGTMGFGLPAAIGAALSEPDRTIICFSGDGSILMNIQELAVLAEENLNVKIVLMNNNSLGLVRQQQTLFYGRRIFASDFAQGPDFVRIAEGFGIRTFDLGEAEDAEAMIQEAFATPGPVLIHAPINAEQKVYPMVAPGGANKHMIVEEAKELATV
jgi:acetolactate synthase-1/2/3 large subunit